METEINVMKLADHPYIVKLYEVWEDDRYIFLVLENCTGGELFNYIVQKKRLSEREASKIFHQLLTSIYYLHQQGIVHRDLKPENLLFASEPSEGSPIKLCDFGLAKLCGNSAQKMTSKIGTPFYIAPEILSDGGYGASCDIWSCGVILYILLSGFPPFYGRTENLIFQKIRSGTYDFNRQEWSSVSESAKNLIRNLLVVNPENRYSMEQALAHPWLSSQEAPVEATLEINVEALNNFTNSVRMKKLVLLCIASQSSDNDIKNLREAFVKLDTNGDGTLSFEEMKQGIASTGNSSINLDALISEMDFDRSGRIDYSEFLASTLDKNVYMQEERLYMAFKVFDKDGSGKISANELKEILGNQGQSDSELWEQLIGECDVNRDGEIDFNEFLALMSSKKLTSL
jgi:calcium-dependent protein kinase